MTIRNVVLRQKPANVDRAGIGHERIAYAPAATARRGLERGVEAVDRGFQRAHAGSGRETIEVLALRGSVGPIIGRALGGIRVRGARHRPGGVEHEGHVRIADVVARGAIDCDVHVGQREKLHDHGWQRGRGGSADRRRALRIGGDESGPLRSEVVARVVDREIFVRDGRCAGGPAGGAHRLAARENPCVARLLEARFDHVGAAHVDAAADHRDQRHHRRGHDREGIARDVTAQAHQEFHVCLSPNIRGPASAAMRAKGGAHGPQPARR